MKKLVNGKSYNTETAELIWSWDNGLSKSKAQWHEESLYKSKNGRWFIYGEGGPLSPVAKICDDGLTSGQFLKALSENDEILGWMEEHDVDTDIAAKYFEIEEA